MYISKDRCDDICISARIFATKATKFANLFANLARIFATKFANLFANLDVIVY